MVDGAGHHGWGWCSGVRNGVERSRAGPVLGLVAALWRGAGYTLVEALWLRMASVGCRCCACTGWASWSPTVASRGVALACCVMACSGLLGVVLVLGLAGCRCCAACNRAASSPAVASRGVNAATPTLAWVHPATAPSGPPDPRQSHHTPAQSPIVHPCAPSAPCLPAACAGSLPPAPRSPAVPVPREAATRTPAGRCPLPRAMALA